MAYIKLMMEMGRLQSATQLNHKTPACPSEDYVYNGVRSSLTAPALACFHKDFNRNCYFKKKCFVGHILQKKVAVKVLQGCKTRAK